MLGGNGSLTWETFAIGCPTWCTHPDASSRRWVRSASSTWTNTFFQVEDAHPRGVQWVAPQAGHDAYVDAMLALTWRNIVSHSEDVRDRSADVVHATAGINAYLGPMHVLHVDEQVLPLR
jgi:hypothetical protein